MKDARVAGKVLVLLTLVGCQLEGLQRRNQEIPGLCCLLGYCAFCLCVLCRRSSN